MFYVLVWQQQVLFFQGFLGNLSNTGDQRASIRIIMYLDDGLGGADTFEKCKDVSLVVKNDLFNFGFIIAEEKSNWNPVQESIWLSVG